MAKKILVIILLVVLALPLFSAITLADAKKIALETLQALSSINLVLKNIKKKEDINAVNKALIAAGVVKLKALKRKVTALRRTASVQDKKLLKSQFNSGEYSSSLNTEIFKLFKNIKRIKAIEGGAEIANMVSL